MSRITDEVAAIVAPVAEKLGLRIWDVEFAKEGGERYLRIFIDKQGGVGIEDCEALSREVDRLLDELDPIEESYIFEVSSAGLERKLSRPSDFEEYMGSPVALKTFLPRNGNKEFLGVLMSYSNGDITLDIDGAQEKFEKKEIASVRLRVEF